MILEWDLDLCTKDMRIVLGATLGGKQLGLPIRVYVTDLHVEGPLRMGFKWMPVAPHLRHMTISFLSVPEVEVKVKPVSSSGLDVTEIPGLQGWIDGLVKQGLQQVRRAGVRTVPYRHDAARGSLPRSDRPTDRRRSIASRRWWSPTASSGTSRYAAGAPSLSSGSP